MVSFLLLLLLLSRSLSRSLLTSIVLKPAAESLEPGFYLKNRLMIAKTLIRMKRNAEAKPWLDKVKTLP